MNSPTPEEVTEKSSAAGQLVEQGTRPAQTHTKIAIDAERMRSSIARLTSNSIDELERLISELQELQEFLKSETGRIQGEIGSVLAGIGIIIESIAPWKTDAASGANARTNGRDKIKRWPTT